ncbi:hypothetical protein AB0D27_44305 [Streptomyces sp. NPDC048415]|uniref:hypothetical protein n=1 Tax=Streptomyces sp. NPDC048415 TaxID=3154822 RepID=UPI0034326BC4
MIQQTGRDEARCWPTAALQMPQQAPPVDRTEAAAAGALNTTPGVEADIVAPFL